MLRSTSRSSALLVLLLGLVAMPTVTPSLNASELESCNPCIPEGCPNQAEGDSICRTSCAPNASMVGCYDSACFTPWGYGAMIECFF